jgi:hypothetical protein
VEPSIYAGTGANLFFILFLSKGVKLLGGIEGFSTGAEH